jgi:hypothetical protein
MRLTLHYRGVLRSNGGTAHKHEIRQHFHTQLRAVWAQRPLVESTGFLQPKRREGDYCFLRPAGDFTFVPLVTEETNTIAELSITFFGRKDRGHYYSGWRSGQPYENAIRCVNYATTCQRASVRRRSTGE